MKRYQTINPSVYKSHVAIESTRLRVGDQKDMWLGLSLALGFLLAISFATFIVAIVSIFNSDLLVVPVVLSPLVIVIHSLILVIGGTASVYAARECGRWEKELDRLHGAQMTMYRL
jgi:hypothetical protein